MMRDEHGEILHEIGVVRDKVPAPQHRLVVGEEAVDFQERRDRHDEHRVVRIRGHEDGERGLGRHGACGDLCKGEDEIEMSGKSK